MTRKLCKIVHDHTMFGHSVSLITSQGDICVQQHAHTDWQPLNQKVVSDYYWFRSPQITLDQLRETMQVLLMLDEPFEFEVWENTNTWDSSLKVTSELDASHVAWSLMGTWVKWSAQQEQEFLDSQKPPPTLKVEIDDQGNKVITGKISVSQIQVPD